MGTPSQLDVTNQPVPAAWLDAAAEAPQPEGHRRRRGDRGGHQAALPETTTLDMFTAVLAAGAVAITGGYAWFELQMRGFANPWIAVAFGVAVAVAVRLGGGRTDVHARSALSLMVYLAASSVIIYLVARTTYLDLYGERPGLTDFEQELLNSRLTEPVAVLAWLAGALAATLTSRLTR